jgi:hypothetical protein
MVQIVECFLDDDLVEAGGMVGPGITMTCSMCDKCVKLQGPDTPENRQKLLYRLYKECPEKLPHRFIVIEDFGCA